ncbi:MAG: enoyl-CoA hydratase-related protein [Actinomycetota bacterium]
MTDTVRCERAGSAAIITLNRPEARNALTTEMKEGLLAVLRQCGGDTDVRAVLITGAGKAFCAGQDLREHASQTAPDALGDTVRQHYNPMVMTIATMRKPVVAALNGVAAGAGAALAFACDFRIAARGASVLMAFARVGLGADTGASWTLQRLVGAGRAAEMLMLAEPMTADQALARGLLNSVVEDAALPSAARDLVDRLSAGPTAAYAAIKESLAYSASHPLPESLEREAELQAGLGATDDHRGATQAFLRKEAPVFGGH